MPRVATLLALFGPKRGVRIELSETCTLGRLSAADVQLIDEKVSREHCRFTLADGTVKVEDPAFEYRRAVVPVANGGQLAVTHWTVRERRADRTLVELDLETGRTHQIRVHLASIGHPVRGDLLYARTPVAGQLGAFSATRIALHSWQVAFTHADRRLELTAEPPVDFDTIE